MEEFLEFLSWSKLFDVKVKKYKNNFGWSILKSNFQTNMLDHYEIDKNLQTILDFVN